MALLLGVLVFPCAASARSYGRGDTGVVDLTNTPSYSETEPSLSVDPTNSARLIAGENRWEPLLPEVPALGADGIVDTSVFSSRDGGRS